MSYPPDIPPGLVGIENLTYRYPPPHPGAEPVRALAGVSARVEPGQVLGICGTGGSGKTTLCLALNGIVPQRTGGTFGGRVQIGDWDTRRRSVAELATRVGIVFQEPEGNFVGLGVADEVAFGPENLGVPPAEIARRVDWALDRVGLSAHREAAPTRLSGGQKQRVAIAAALAMLPAVLVLDEPTAALDPVGAAEVLDLLASLAASGDTTIILVSQDADALAAHADHLLALDAGQVVASGTPRDVFTPHRLPALRQRGLPTPVAAELAAAINERSGTAFAFLTPAEAERELITHRQSATSPRSRAPGAGARG